ncbi:MAG: transporter [Cyanobacteria bacterium RYN_339]|nr:transporter [Cyanobacteria bacterium RYN_339]
MPTVGDLFGFAWRHRLALRVLIAMLFLAGLAMAFTLPVGLFPNVSFPRVVINVDAGELPGDQVMVQITRPLEEALSSVPGLQRLRSATTRGGAEISTTFTWGADMAAVTTLVESRVNQARAALPAGTTLEIRRMDPTVFPVAAYSLVSDTRSQAELNDLALEGLRPLLLRAPGVAKVGVVGGDRRELTVALDPTKLRAHRLAAQAVVDAVAKENVLATNGLMESTYRLYQVLTDGRTLEPDALARLAVATDARGQAIHVGDLGEVRAGYAPRFTRITADNHEAVLISVYQQPGGNTVALDAGVRAALADAGHILPPDVRLRQFYDQAALIVAAMGSVRDSILIGIALGVGVIWLFLRKLRLTLLAALSVPITLGIAILGLGALHQGFNVMTLGGLAAAVGLILDDAIVLIENVARHLGRHDDPSQAARSATNELAVPFIGSSLCSIVVFAPLAFLTGVSGAFFRSLSLTMAVALAVSLAVTLFLLPPLAARFLRPEDVEPEHTPGRLGRAYAATLRWLLPRPWPVLLAGVALAAGTVGLYLNLPNGFLPTMDEGAFILDYTSAPGTALGETDRELRQVEAVLAKTPEVASYSRRTGAQLGGGLTEPNQGDFLVKLKDQRSRAIEAVIADVRGQVEGAVPGLRVEFLQLMEDLVGDLTAVPQPIEVIVSGPDLAVDQSLARRIAALLPKVPGVVDIFDGITVSGPALRARIDRDAAARYGLTAADVENALTLATGGRVAGAVLKGPRMVDLRVRLGDRPASSPEQLAQVPVALAGGASLPLGDVAHLELEPGTTEIGRENLQQMVAVTARIEGAGLGATVDKVRQAVAAGIKLPAGVTLTYGGLYAEQQASFKGLLAVIVAALALVTLVLLFEFGSAAVPAAVLVVDVLSLFGVLAALALTGMPVNVSSLMGAVMIVGIVAENAVFFIHYVQDGMKTGLGLDDAILHAGATRARPVLMTTMAAILALLPLALGLGAGAQMQRPLAIAVIGGFALSSALILLVLPVLFRLAQGKR